MRGDAAAGSGGGAVAGQPRGGGQPAISPCAFVPHELSHPFVPEARLVSSCRVGYAAAARARARLSGGRVRGTCQGYRWRP